MKRLAVRIIKRLRRAGFQAYVVGGAVRDIVMGKRPKDYDITTDARPEQIKELFARTIPVGAAFGVVVVAMPYRNATRCFEVATFRHDRGISDGRHPDEVIYTADVKEDVIRRDFTINGLLLDPLSNEIIDHVGGLEDIERHRLRAIGDPSQRFLEDRLRMLRAVRFATTLGFDLDEPSARAIQTHATTITTLSWERIAEELRRILTSAERGRGIRMLHTLELLQPILPEVAACEGVTQDERFHPEGDVLTHTLLTLEALRRPDFALALAALLHDIAKPVTRVESDRIRFHGHDQIGAEMAETVCRRLKLSRAEREKVVELVRCHMRFIDLQKMREGKVRRFLESPLSADHIELHRADCLSSHRKLDKLRYIAALRRRWSRRPPATEPLLRGRDLLKLGYRPGPRIGRILEEVKELQLEGRLSNSQAAREYALKYHPPIKSEE